MQSQLQRHAPTETDVPTPAAAGMTRRTGVLAALGALLSGCSGVNALNALVSRDTYDAQLEIAYGPDPRQKLDVYRPKADNAKTPKPAKGWPVVVFFYGGAWSHGERADYRFIGEALASGGVVAVLADYRLSPQVRYPVFLEDSAAATAWAFRELASLGGDPARLFVMGHSAGAYNAAMLALDGRWLAAHTLSPARLAGWIGIAGPYDFLPIGDPETQVAFEWPRTQPESQPVNHVTPRAPRALLIAPENDKVVDPQRSTEGLARRLRDAGVPVTVKRLGGVSHVTVIASVARPLSFLAPVREEVLGFVGV